MSFMLIHFQATNIPNQMSAVQVVYRRAADGKMWRRDWNTHWPAHLVRVVLDARQDVVEIELDASAPVEARAVSAMMTHDGEHLIVSADPSPGPYGHHIDRATELLVLEGGAKESSEPTDGGEDDAS